MLSKRSLSKERKGPPEAVNQRARTVCAGLSSRHWKMAECSESTANTRTWCLAASFMTNSPAMTRISLEATAMSLPARMAAKAGSKPAVPTMAIRTTSASGKVASRSNPDDPDTTSTPSCNPFESSSILHSSPMLMHWGRCAFACSRSKDTLRPPASPMS